MSYALHVYFLEKQNHNSESAFDSVKKLFSNTGRVAFTLAQNIFTKKEYLKLTVDSHYSISVFFDDDTVIADDLEYILGKRLNCHARMRFLLAPDPENNFDDIGVIILHYLESLKEVVIYSVNQNKIILDSTH